MTNRSWWSRHLAITECHYLGKIRYKSLGTITTPMFWYENMDEDDFIIEQLWAESEGLA